MRKFLALTLPPVSVNPKFYPALLIIITVFIGLLLAWLPLNLAMLIVGGAVFAVLALLKPILSLYLLIPIIPFSSLLAVQLGGFRLGLMEVVLAFGLVAWLIKLLTRNPPAKIEGGPLVWLFLLLLGGVSLSWLNALSISATLVESVKWIEMLALYIFIVNTLPRREIKWVVIIIILAGMAQAALGLYQFIYKVGPPGFELFGGRFLRAYGTFAQPNPYGGYLGLVLPLTLSLTLWGVSKIFSSLTPSLAQLSSPSGRGVTCVNLSNLVWGKPDQRRLYPPQSPLAGGKGDVSQAPPPGRGRLGGGRIAANVQPQTLKLTHTEAGGEGFLSRVEKGTPASRSALNKLYLVIKAAVLSLPLGLLLAALFASQSRGAWLGFAAASVVTIMVRNKKTATFVISLALFAAVIALIGSFDFTLPSESIDDTGSPYAAVTQRFVDAAAILSTDIAKTPVTDANFATLERLAHWQAAITMWNDNPWLGVGFGNYAAVYPAYAMGQWLDPLGHAHNYLLNIGAEAGLAGILAYLIFWIFTFGLLWQAVRYSRDFYQAVAIGGVGILVHLHVHNMVDNLYVQGMYLHIAIILGLVSVIYKRAKQKNQY